MISIKEIEKLAELSRMELSTEEKRSLQTDFDSILGYVGDVNKVSGKHTERKAGVLRNVLREDTNPHESGVFTEELLKAAPARQEDYFKVKKIL